LMHRLVLTKYLTVLNSTLVVHLAFNLALVVRFCVSR
jgi:hypothetical protein